MEDAKVISASELKNKLYVEKVIDCNGMRVKIRKLGPVDFLETEQIPGMFRLAEESKKQGRPAEELVKEKYSDVKNVLELIKECKPLLLKGVVEPKIVDKTIDQCQADEVPISILFNDVELAMKIVTEISALSFGLAGVDKSFPSEQEQGAVGLPDGAKVQEAAK